MRIYIKNWLPNNIPTPWNFTFYNPDYSGQFLAWNLQVRGRTLPGLHCEGA